MVKKYKRLIRDTIAGIALLACISACFVKAMLIVLL